MVTRNFSSPSEEYLRDQRAITKSRYFGLESIKGWLFLLTLGRVFYLEMAERISGLENPIKTKMVCFTWIALHRASLTQENYIEGGSSLAADTTNVKSSGILMFLHCSVS